MLGESIDFIYIPYAGKVRGRFPMLGLAPSLLVVRVQDADLLSEADGIYRIAFFLIDTR